MKKNVLTFTACILACAFSACTPPSSETADLEARIEELEASLESLEEENETLKDSLQASQERNGFLRGKKTDPASARPNKTAGQNDFVIPFSSDTFKEEMVGITGVSDREITYGDVKDITELLYNYPDGNGSELQYFTGLKELNCSNVGNLNVLSGMKDLSVLTVTDNADIHALAN